MILFGTWWSEKFAEMKRLVANRKVRVRTAALVRRAMVVSLYLEAKKKFEEEANKAQIESWKEFCGKQDR